ncbi:Electron transport complex protein [Sodalis praecaptivus]|uniref:Ion-translocating oxidoreductase complex subunit C n=1 Tax=Sodalis praecaptivus TaxID=1239307 RepID=W0HTB8_9GAMM|nr:electron transport complex subunit RsxC [Sodalis praecaptivus]AHF77076.1 Electron transport complex protein [Sodalis praecaptivus]
MFNLLSALRKQRLWDFPGGIHPPEMKSQSSGVALKSLPLPDKLIIPLKQHLGPEGELRVTVGDHVLRGQPLTAGSGRTLPVHAPTSGTIAAITAHRTAHPSGLAELSVILLPDGDDRWVTRQPLTDFRQCPPAQLLERIHQSGIAGLGGAGFPTAAKLSGGMSGVETLIINGAECEPYITADDRLMQEHAGDIVTGMAVLRHLLQPQRLLLGVEDNKPDAITALKAALRGSPVGELRVIPTKYPSGGAKQLTKILTGKEVPVGQHSAAIGVAMLNVGTVYAIKRAIIDGEALTERVVTLTGEALARPGNVWARLGTPVSHLLTHAGFSPAAQPIVIMGGPLMGFTLPALDVPVVKISNCLLAPSERELAPTEPEQSCIRCSRCADACPASLLPQQLYWFSRGQEHDKARQHHLFDCIECGACAYVCPSNIPLVQYYRQQKAEIRALDDDARRAAQAKARYEAKLARREREKQQRLVRHQQAAVKLDAATAALNGTQPVNAVTADGSPQDAVAAAIARVKARRQAVPNGQSLPTPSAAPADPAAEREVSSADPRKEAVAAAIARVKARRQAVPDGQSHPTPSAPPADPAAAREVSSADPRKEAVAAAIARVKARRQAAPDGQSHPTPSAAPADPAAAREGSSADPRKEAVAAAIARVKARRLEAQSGAARRPQDNAPRRPAGEISSSDNVTHIDTATTPANGSTRSPTRDNREATQTVSPAAGAAPTHHAASPEVMNADPRKEAVAAAIARVKARRQAAQETAALARRETTRPSTDDDCAKSDTVMKPMIAAAPPAGESHTAGAASHPPLAAGAAIPARQKAEHNVAAATTVSSEED